MAEDSLLTTERLCQAQTTLALFNVSYVDRFVDDLFPMAQSVLEATPLATCARVR